MQLAMATPHTNPADAGMLNALERLGNMVVEGQRSMQQTMNAALQHLGARRSDSLLDLRWPDGPPGHSGGALGRPPRTLPALTDSSEHESTLPPLAKPAEAKGVKDHVADTMAMIAARKNKGKQIVDDDDDKSEGDSGEPPKETKKTSNVNPTF